MFNNCLCGAAPESAVTRWKRWEESGTTGAAGEREQLMLRHPHGALLHTDEPVGALRCGAGNGRSKLAPPRLRPPPPPPRRIAEAGGCATHPVRGQLLVGSAHEA